MPSNADLEAFAKKHDLSAEALQELRTLVQTSESESEQIPTEREPSSAAAEGALYAHHATLDVSASRTEVGDDRTVDLQGPDISAADTNRKKNV